MKFRNGIIIFMITFVIFIVTLGVLMQRANSDLVSDDYYVKDRSYQNDLDAFKCARKHNFPLNIQVEKDGSLEIQMNDSLEPLNLDLYFLRPNDKRMDKSISLSFRKSKFFKINDSFLNTGIYQVRGRYIIQSDSCLQEFKIEIP